MYKKNKFYILFSVCIFFCCKNKYSEGAIDHDATSDTIAHDEGYNNTIETGSIAGGDVVLNNVLTNTLLVVDSNMTTEMEHGDKINIVDYLEPLGFTSEAKKIQIGSGKEILLLRYFSGGAHCCYIYEAFTYDADINAYRYQDQFYCEECSGELIYPIPYHEWMDYFYCAYAYGGPINCPNADYSSSMHLIDGKFVAKVKGKIKVLERCFTEFCKTATVPELNENGDDDGTRESVLNLLYRIYTLGPKDIEDVKKLYFRHFPSVKDKETLWGDIEEFILSNRIVIYQHNNQNIKQ